MADYNLGRAEGQIRITADTSGARQAQAAMAETAAEAAALDAAMGRVNRSFDENNRQNVATAESIVRARGEVEELRRTYERYQQEYERGQAKVAEATERAADALRDQRDDLDALREARIKLDTAEREAERLRIQAADSYEQYRDKVAAVRLEVERFNAAHVNAANGFRNMRNEAEKFGEVLESVTEKLSSIARILGQAGIFGLFGGAAAGQLFASLAGGMNVLVTAAAAAIEVVNSLIGALALLPAVVNGAVIGLGTLALSLHGVGTALSSIGDPKKFVEAIRDMSPAAQQAMLSIQQFTNAFRGVRDQLQESLFAPIVADIEPLIKTWLPQLMNVGKLVAGEFGQAFHQVFEYFKSSGAQSSFQSFANNLVAGFRAARGAIEPFLQAWNKLAEVGSQVFPRLGAAITDIATKFNSWIERTAQSGQLLDFINKALDGFTNMGRIVRDLGLGLNNMLGVFQSQSGSALETIANLAAKFREWSQSVSGQNAIFSFFSLLKTASEAVRPALSLIGDSLAIVGRTLTELGIAIQPGIASFFQSFKEALQGLAPYVKEMAPAINQLLIAFGQTLQQIVATLGPRLPALFKDLSDAFVQIMQILPPVAEAFATLLDHMSPGTVVTILSLVGALKLLSVTLAGLKAVGIAVELVAAAGPAGLLAIAIGALIAAGVLLVQNWDQVKAAFDRTWDAIRNGVTGLWNDAYSWGSNLIDNLVRGIKEAAESVLKPAVDIVSSMFPDNWLTHSPAKKGPLSQVSPNEMGSRLVTNFAAGVSDASPSIDAAAAGIAGSASGIGGGGFGSTGFSSAGVSGKSGKDFSQGNSGFDQWVSFITQDLTAWNNIFREAFSLVNAISGIVTGTLKVAANLWDGGNNPLTQPGGLFGPPLPISQQEVPGVPSKPIPGVAPDQYGKDLAAVQSKGQQEVPGVPSMTPGGQRKAAPPAAPAGGGPQTVPLTQNPDGTWTSPDPTWAALIKRESGGINQRQKITDANSGGNEAEGIFQITPQTWKANGGEEFAPNPLSATPQQQAQVAARVLGSDPGAWGFYRHPGEREDPAKLAAGLTGGAAPTPNTDNFGAVPTASIPAPIDATNSGLPSNDRGGVKPDLFLAHTQEGNGTPESLIEFQKNQGKYSYNQYINSDTGQVVTGVDPSRAAVATGGVNQRSINAVFAGSRAEWTREEWLQRMPALQSFAKLAAESGVPLQSIEGNTDPNASGIGGHDWATGAGFKTDGHSDPGPGFPWDVVMGMAQQYAAGKDPGQIAAARGGDTGFTNGPTAPGIGSSQSDYALPIAGVLGAGGSAALVAALKKRAAQRKMALGEALDVDEARLALEPETAAETKAVKSAPPEVARAIPPELRVPQTNINGGVLPGGDARGAATGVDARGNVTVDAGGNRITTAPDGTRTVNPLPEGRPPTPVRGATPPIAPEPASIAPADTRVPGGAAKPVPASGEPIGPGGARLSPMGVKALAGGAALNALFMLPWAWETSEALVRNSNAKEARERGEVPTFNEDDFGRTILGPGGGVDTGTVSRPMTPEEIAKYGDGSKPSAPAGPAGPPAFSANPRSLANIPLKGTTSNAVRQAGLAPLYKPGTTEVPNEIQDLAKAFNLKASTYADGGSLHQSGFAFDFTGKPEDMDNFAEFIYNNLGSQTLELIHASGSGGPGDKRWGIAGTRRVDAPGTMPYFDKDGVNQYASHDNVSDNAHVHWATDVAPIPRGQPVPPSSSTAAADTKEQSKGDWMRVPPTGWDLKTPIPKDVIAKNMPSLTPEQIAALPPMFYAAQPGTVSNVPVPKDYSGDNVVSPGGTISVPTTTGAPVAGFPETNDQRSPMQKFTTGMQAVGSVVGDAFTVFQDVIASIGAAANITDTLVRGFENTETVVNFIQQFQTFIKTGADIAKLVGDTAGAIGSMIPSAGGADFGGTEGAKAALGAVSAVASIVQSAFEVTNAAISLGIEVYHEVGKYAGFMFGGFLGGAATGPLGGNVRMLLNTRTNQLQTYSEQNPGAKNTFNIPMWQRSYDQQTPAPSLPPQINIYTGPGQTPQGMMQESMWLVSTGSAPVASVAGHD